MLTGILFIVPGQTNFLHSWLRQHFQIKTTVGTEENLEVYQLDNDIRIVRNLVNI